MKILIAVSAPFNESTGGREWQWQRTNLAKAVELIASRIQLGSNGDTVSVGNIQAHFRVEPSEQSAPAEGQAA